MDAIPRTGEAAQDHGSGDGREAPIHDWESRCLDCGEELLPDGEEGWARL
jgi:hypothetical protein